MKFKPKTFGLVLSNCSHGRQALFIKILTLCFQFLSDPLPKIWQYCKYTQAYAFVQIFVRFWQAEIFSYCTHTTETGKWEMWDTHLFGAFPSHQAWLTVPRLVFKIGFCMEKRRDWPSVFHLYWDMKACYISWKGFSNQKLPEKLRDWGKLEYIEFILRSIGLKLSLSPSRKICSPCDVKHFQKIKKFMPKFSM